MHLSTYSRNTRCIIYLDYTVIDLVSHHSCRYTAMRHAWGYAKGKVNISYSIVVAMINKGSTNIIVRFPITSRVSPQAPICALPT